MSIIDRLFNNGEEPMPDSWQKLDKTAQLEQLKQLSEEKPVAVFKHSNRCGISHMAKHQLERDWNFNTDDIAFFFLDIFEHRQVSNAVAEIFGVTHQSPQLIVLKDGAVIHHTSHHRVGVEELRTALQKD